MPIYVINNGKMVSTSTGKQLTGEKIPGDLDAWDYYGTDPNLILTYNYDVLCQRSTTLFHTHAPVSAGINKSCMYAIGPGLHFRSQPDWKTLGIEKDKAKEWGMQFQSLVHYAFLMLNFYSKQSVLFRTADIMGDSVLLFDREEQPDGMPFDIIDTGGDFINFEAQPKSTEQITLGIIHDKFLRKIGIVQNDENQTHIDFKNSAGDQNVIQFYNKQMARQLRGFPLAYKIIAAAKNYDRFIDATLARAVLESIMLGVVNNTESNFGSQVDTLADSVRDEAGYSPRTSVTQDATVAQLASGGMFQFQGKGEIKYTDLKTPSNNFDKFNTAHIDICGMALDIPPEVLMSKYSTSFTAHKGALNDFVKSYTLKRHNFQKTVCYPVLLEIAKWLFLNKYIDMPKSDFFSNPITQMATLAGNWLGPVPGHINPAQEVSALVMAKEKALITPADAAAQYGSGEYEDFIEEWKQQMEEFNAMSPDEQAEVVQEQEEEINENEEEQE